MKSMLLLIYLTLVIVTSASRISVQVGPGLTFSPDSVSGGSGDVVDFHFANTYHDITQGSFDLGCSPSGPNAIYSGRPEGEDQVFRLTLNSTSDVIWIYSSQQGDCQGGMVMVINGPTSGAETLYDYRQVASQTEYSEQPANVEGGVWMESSSSDDGDDDNGSSTMSSPSETASATSAASTPSSTSNVAVPAGGADWTKTGMTMAGLAAGLLAFLL